MTVDVCNGNKMLRSLRSETKYILIEGFHCHFVWQLMVDWNIFILYKPNAYKLRLDDFIYSWR